MNSNHLFLSGADPVVFYPAILYFFTYFMNLVVCFVSLSSIAPHRNNILSGLRSLNLSPVYFFFFSISLLSMMGIPPFCGFIAKTIALLHFFNFNIFLSALAFFMLLLVSTVFYLQIVKHLRAFSITENDVKNVGSARYVAFNTKTKLSKIFTLFWFTFFIVFFIFFYKDFFLVFLNFFS